MRTGRWLARPLGSTLVMTTDPGPNPGPGPNPNPNPDQGTRRYAASGDEYAGEWASGVVHGAGVLRFAASGDVFEGLFDRGGVRGAARLATRAGEVVEGHFEGMLAEPRLQVTLALALTLTLTPTLTPTLALTLTRGVACCAALRASGTRAPSSSAP